MPAPTDAAWADARRRYAEGESVSAIAECLGVARSTVRNRARKESWLRTDAATRAADEQRRRDSQAGRDARLEKADEQLARQLDRFAVVSQAMTDRAIRMLLDPDGNPQRWVDALDVRRLMLTAVRLTEAQQALRAGRGLGERSEVQAWLEWITGDGDGDGDGDAVGDVGGVEAETA